VKKKLTFENISSVRTNSAGQQLTGKGNEYE
jgi:hypothetical protein